MHQIVELAIPARAEYVGLVRLVVATVAADRRDLDDDRIADLKLAVSEACTNAVEAHASAPSEERVIVRCLEDDEFLEIRVDDRGCGFDPAALPVHPPVTDPARLDHERGLGIPLIRALVDKVEFSSSPEGTSARLVLRCRRSALAPQAAPESSTPTSG
jgi:serine/threonine-protein kinase RsbW